MIHIGTAVLVNPLQEVTPFGMRTVPAPHSILVVRDVDKNNEFLESICDFLDVGVEHASPRDDLLPLLRGLRPLAVIADLDGEIQDGFHVMKVAAGYQRTLPVMLLADNDPALLGAVDAIREVWGMTHVATIAGVAQIGPMVDFICQAARHAGMPRLMRV